jgi:hypothetical protein
MMTSTASYSFFLTSVSYSFLLIGHRLNHSCAIFLLPESALSILGGRRARQTSGVSCYIYYHSSDPFDHVFDHLYDLFDQT